MQVNDNTNNKTTLEEVIFAILCIDHIGPMQLLLLCRHLDYTTDDVLTCIDRLFRLGFLDPSYKDRPTCSGAIERYWLPQARDWHKEHSASCEQVWARLEALGDVVTKESQYGTSYKVFAEKRG